MRDYHINIFYSEDDGGYIADIPEWEEIFDNTTVATASA